jgi:hypothetical protein
MRKERVRQHKLISELEAAIVRRALMTGKARRPSSLMTNQAFF